MTDEVTSQVEFGQPTMLVYSNTDSAEVAFNKGKMAHAQGMRISDHPVIYSEDQRKFWEQGWRSANIRARIEASDGAD